MIPLLILMPIGQTLIVLALLLLLLARQSKTVAQKAATNKGRNDERCHRGRVLREEREARLRDRILEAERARIARQKLNHS